MLALLGVACYRDATTRRRLAAKITVAHHRIRCRMLTLIIVWMLVRITGFMQSADNLYVRCFQSHDQRIGCYGWVAMCAHVYASGVLARHVHEF